MKRSITALSQQARDYEEWLRGTLQSCLVVAFRLAGIHALEAGNAFLATYIEQMHNPRFVA